MYGGRGDFKKVLQISLGGRASIDFGICVDESQILALFVGETRRLHGLVVSRPDRLGKRVVI